MGMVVVVVVLVVVVVVMVVVVVVVVVDVVVVVAEDVVVVGIIIDSSQPAQKTARLKHNKYKANFIKRNLTPFVSLNQEGKSGLKARKAGISDRGK
jgi:hypothetical protein